MDIKGLDYNTQREKLLMPEYGREIQQMVKHAISLDNKDERTRCANAIVKLMATKMSHLNGSEDFNRTLWDHLFLISEGQLDIEWPYDVTTAESIHTKPQPLPLPQNIIRQRHYGRLVEELFEKLKNMDEGPQRDELARLTANQMKRDLATWGHGSMDNEKVADDMARFTDGKIQLDLKNFVFEKVTATARPDTTKQKKKKKK
jgi:hypothetical protein